VTFIELFSESEETQKFSEVFSDCIIEEKNFIKDERKLEIVVRSEKIIPKPLQRRM